MSKTDNKIENNKVSQPKKRFVIVHNIPSPYRLHMFNLLNERLKARGVDFHVHFMARSHQHRHYWEDYSKKVPFPHTFWFNAGPTINGRKWDFNPGIMAALTGQFTDYLMLGGVWDSFTNLFIALLGRRSVGIAWCEGNTSTPGRITGLILNAKRSLLRHFQVLAVPGFEGRKYMELVLGSSDPKPKIVTLPNIVDETLFSPDGQDVDSDRRRIRSELKIAIEVKIAIWPARLIPDKGIAEFLSHLTRDDLKGWVIVILGEGPLREDIEKIISERNFKNNVLLISCFPYEKMPLLYRAADLFLLPSILDPNPLSVVEAIHSGLPILVSKRIGNFPEALQEGRNGWGIDPLDGKSVKFAVREAFTIPLDKLRHMGEKSRAIAADFWGSARAIDTFLDGIPVSDSDRKNK